MSNITHVIVLTKPSGKIECQAAMTEEEVIKEIFGDVNTPNKSGVAKLVGNPAQSNSKETVFVVRADVQNVIIATPQPEEPIGKIVPPNEQERRALVRG